jgi:hypothetical protein
VADGFDAFDSKGLDNRLDRHALGVLSPETLSHRLILAAETSLARREIQQNPNYKLRPLRSICHPC